jgi:hypothetical protein
MHVDIFAASIGVMNDNSMELNRRPIDSDLYPLESAAIPANIDSVAIRSSIHTGLSQIDPTARYLWIPAAGPLSNGDGAEA